MHTIIYNSDEHHWDEENQTFEMSEKGIPFGTQYQIKNPATGGTSDVFKFVKATGPEFDPRTSYIYVTDGGMKLILWNDFKITQKRGDMYLKAKLKNMGHE